MESQSQSQSQSQLQLQSQQQIICKFNNGDVNIPITIAYESKTIANMLNDLGYSCEISYNLVIPISQGKTLTNLEIELFFKLVNDYYIIHNNNESCFFTILQKHEISNDLLFEYVKLSNFLDYEYLLDSLCKYIAILIRDNHIYVK
jgi:hypothetical protein